MAARAAFEGSPPRDFLAHTVIIDYEENTGAMLSIGAGLPAPVRFWLFTFGISLLLAILGVFVFLRSRSVSEIASGALAIGGGLGNLYDRLTYNGAVIDFISIGIGSLRTAIFNLADVLILTGVLLYLVGVLRRGTP
jgi:signal peptidase II